MAYIFGDGFDCYATTADPIAGYWDSGTAGFFSLQPGRFTGSQCLRNVSSGAWLAKSSAVNDAVHHIVCAVWQSAALTGTTLGLYLQLSDAATNQVCIVFRSDGAVLLTSATPAGTVLATYSGAVSAQNTWTAFEFEVIISGTVGGMRVRKNGNTSNDYDSFISVGNLNTRPGANSYANKLTLGQNTLLTSQQIDDILWRSDASSVPFVGDIRCYTRMPASDASVQFARSPTTTTQTPFVQNGNIGTAAGIARYTPFTAAWNGTVSSGTVSMNTGFTGNLKCSVFASSGTGPTTVIASANNIANPAIGTNVLTFGTPFAMVKGTQYWLGFVTDVTSGTWATNSTTSAVISTTPYASFPVASPVLTLNQTAVVCAVNFALTVNSDLVSETLQDGTTTYVFDSTVGHADFYTLAPLGVTPASVVATITRGFVCKSDAGARTGAVQIKSGGTTVASAAPALSTSFGWLWRSDVVDPATGSAWTAAGVNAATIGPVVIS